MSAIIRVHPRAQLIEPFIQLVRVLESAGYSISNVRARHFSFEARPIINRVTPISLGVSAVLAFGERPQ